MQWDGIRATNTFLNIKSYQYLFKCAYPHAMWLPEGAYAQALTHVVGKAKTTSWKE